MKGNQNNVDNTKKLKDRELTHISLCTGYGGIDLGLKRALGAIRTVCYVEIEAFAIQNLVAKIEAGGLDAAPIFTDLKTFPWELFNGKVDLLSGGFPCQPFSAAGRKKGSEDSRHLWPYITDGIKRLGRPAVVYFENVEGIISSKLKGEDWADPEGTPVLLHVLRELERLGYKATASVFSASEVGAPHRRKRVFILGVRNELAETGISLIDELIKRNTKDAMENPYHLRCGPRKESDDKKRGTMDRTRQSVQSERNIQADIAKLSSGSYRGTAYPASRGQRQYWYEPPRVTRELHRQTKSSLGRDVNGSTDRLDYAELYQSCNNRTDELRMLGNGVVPDTATRAFRTLWRELVNSTE